MRVFPFSIALLAFAALAQAQPGPQWPTTRAEATDFKETSTYADVVSFLRQLQVKGAPISVQMIGVSTEGREIPMAIASVPPVSSPAEARRLGKPIVYIQANIHAGEVEGKEAAQIILRRLSQEGADGLLSKIVLLVVPIYNTDGNERFGPVERNRPGQDGPTQVGVRTNGQGFDLNRDAMKSESPETQALLNHVYNTWDPDVMMDLHTTDGTRHGYDLTYSPPLNPNTHPEIMRLARDVILPHVNSQLTTKHNQPLFDYGNTERRNDAMGWYTFGQEGRYCTNYAGLRNRIGILSEAVTFIPFKDRVAVTDRFVMETLRWVADHGSEVIAATRRADAQVAALAGDEKTTELGVRFEMASRGVEPVRLEKPPVQGQPRNTKRPTEIELVEMPVYDRFRPTRTAKLPTAYLIPADQENVVKLLLDHGIVVEKILDPWTTTAHQFTVSSFTQAERPFQGHRAITLEGAFQDRPIEAAAGSYLVRTSQPLAILAFHLLEPESLDGVVAWNFMGDDFPVNSVFPISKLFGEPRIATVRVPRPAAGKASDKSGTR